MNRLNVELFLCLVFLGLVKTDSNIKDMTPCIIFKYSLNNLKILGTNLSRTDIYL